MTVAGSPRPSARARRASPNDRCAASSGDALSTPLTAADRVIGVPNVKRAAGGDAFDDLEQPLVTDLAEELARAVGPGPTFPAATAVAEPGAPRDEAPVQRLRILCV